MRAKQVALVRVKASDTRLNCTLHESGEVTENVNESRVNPEVVIFELERVFGIRQSDWQSRQSWERVEFLCSHETTAQWCDSSFSVRVAQLVASVLFSTLTSHAGLESYQSQTHLPSQRVQHTCDTCLTFLVVLVVVVEREERREERGGEGGVVGGGREERRGEEREEEVKEDRSVGKGGREGDGSVCCWW